MAKKAAKQEEYLTCVGRMLYMYFHEPQTTGKYANDQYHVQFLIPKDDESWNSDEMKQLKSAMLKMARGYFSDPDLDFKDFAHPFVNGDKKKQEYMHGFFKINPKSKYPVPVVGPDGVTIFEEKQVKALKNGDWGRLLVAPYCYGEEPGESGGVALGLRLVQYSHAGKEIVGKGVTEKLKLLGPLKVDLSKVSSGAGDDEDDTDNMDEDDVPAKKKAAPSNGKKPIKKLAERGEDAEEDELDDDSDDDSSGDSIVI